MDRINGLTRFIPIQMCGKDVVGIVTFDQTPVVQKVDSAIHRINHYPLDSAILLVSLILMHWMVIYPVDSAVQLFNNSGQLGLLPTNHIIAAYITMVYEETFDVNS